MSKFALPSNEEPSRCWMLFTAVLCFSIGGITTAWLSGGSVRGLAANTAFGALRLAPERHQTAAPYGSGCTNATTPEAFLAPRKELYDKIQADPSLLERDPSLLKEFEAAPWLLPPRTKLPYSDIHDLDQLLEIRKQPVPGYEQQYDKSIAFVISTMHDGRAVAGVQNWVYSIVKFAQVTNYIVLVWSEEAIKVCKDVNLPCADIQPIWNKHGFNTQELRLGHRLGWSKTLVGHYVLHKDFVVHVSDADVGYAAKPMWKSYMKILTDPPADAAFMNEEMGMGPLNSGNWVFLPTKWGKIIMDKWVDGAPGAVKEGYADQHFMNGDLSRNSGTFSMCRSRQHCLFMNDEEMKANLTGKLGRVRTHHASFWSSSLFDFCALNRPDAPQVDLCDWEVLFVHSACAGSERKAVLLFHQNLWFFEGYSNATGPGCPVQLNATSGAAVACPPLVWMKPNYERPVTECARDISLQYDRPIYTRRRKLIS